MGDEVEWTKTFKLSKNEPELIALAQQYCSAVRIIACPFHPHPSSSLAVLSLALVDPYLPRSVVVAALSSLPAAGTLLMVRSHPGR